MVKLSYSKFDIFIYNYLTRLNTS